MVEEIVSVEDFDKAIATPKLVVVDFYAVWCGPCKAVAPVIDEIASSTPEAVFIKVDVDKCEAVFDTYDVQAMPTFKLFKDGKEIGLVVGPDVPKLKELIAGNK